MCGEAAALTLTSEQLVDRNDTQLPAARALGLTEPLEDRTGLEPTPTLPDGRALVGLQDNDHYWVAHLTHSVPWVTPEVPQMLDEIGRRFWAELDSRGLGRHRFCITSALRTVHDQDDLRATNANASRDSAHFYGTTVDISYVYWQSSRPVVDSTVIRITRQRSTIEECRETVLREAMKQVLVEMRSEGWLWGLEEIHQPCFHITARERD